jgi:hypothetical protein
MPTLPSFAGPAIGAAGDIAGGIGSLIQGQATAAGDRAAAQGYTQEANLYSQASQIAGQNLTIEQQNVALQQYMTARSLRQTQAGVVAATAANNLGLSGSEQYIMQQNATQGGLASAIIGEQGAIQENAYAIQQTTLQGEAAQATAASKAAQAAAGAADTGGFLGLLGGIAKGAAAVIPFLP